MTSHIFEDALHWSLNSVLLKYPFLVKLGSILTVIAFKMGLPIKSIVKTTIFRQFCGGETIDESEDRISQLARYNVGTILDYSVEGKENDSDFEKQCGI